MEEKKLKFLIADTTAFINNVHLHEYAEKILTVPDVVFEVKNRRQIRRLVVLPFDLEVVEPKAENLKIVTDFAKKTGDYASLSGIDMKVIALTYELEKENVGLDHLRMEPVLAKTVVSKEKPEELHENSKLAGFYTPEKGVNSDESDDDEEEDDEEVVQKETSEAEESNQKDEIIEEEEITDEQLEKCFENLKFEDDGQNTDILVPEKDEESESDEQEEQQEDNQEEEDDDNNMFSWITPSNMKKVKKQLEGKVEDDVVPVVGCMSTDFAIQNVLKQMNLNVCALNGRVIKNIRTYILRCYACFKTTSIITKVFCPNCGNKTLKKVAVSLDENGKQVIHINTRRPLTKKYKNQSLPRFSGGKHSRNPIICEDQPMPKQMPSRVAKTKTNALEEDYVAGYSPFVMRDVDSKSALLRQKGNVKEWARNNIYEENRRKRNNNRLVK